MLKKAAIKKLILFVVLTISFVIFCGSLFSYADTYNTVYAEGNIYVESKLKLTDTNGIRYASSIPIDFDLPYKYSANNAISNIISYNDIFSNGVENINAQEIFFNFGIYFNDIIKSNEFIKVKMSYKYQPGRAAQLNFQELLNNGRIGLLGTKNSGVATTIFTFDEVTIIDNTVTEISPTSYLYTLEFEFRVPNNSILYGIDITCPTVIINQKINSTGTNINAMMFGLQSAEVLINTTNNINKENVENAQNEANRIDSELGDLSNGLVVATPSPDDLLNQADPFAIVDLRDFESFADVFSFIKDNGLVTGMISLTFIFVLFKYVLFGKG